MSSKLTWADAAYEVLKKAKEPLKPNEIVDQAIKFGMIGRKAKANAQMAALIRQDMRTNEEAGRQARFFSIGKGRYGLTEWLKGRKVTIADLAFWILKAENRVLHYGKIADQISKIRDLGNTPEIAVHSVISKDRAFKQFGKGKFGLARWKKQKTAYTTFVFGTPKEFWKMTQRLSKLFKSSRQIVKVCSPYIDKSTFDTFLTCVRAEIETQLVVSKDTAWKDKVRRGLSGDFLKKFNANRRLFVRRVEDLHSRFVIIDDAMICLMSSDLQKDQQTNKYQYAYLTNDPSITKQTIAYFTELWEDGVVCDLEAEARAP